MILVVQSTLSFFRVVRTSATPAAGGGVLSGGD